MTQGIKSHGTQIGISNEDSPETFANLTEGFAVPSIGGTNALIDFSNHDTVDFKDYQVEDLAEGEELACQANYIPGDTNQGKFYDAYADKEEHRFLVTFRDGSTLAFPGRCLGWHIDPSELDGRVMISFNIKIVGSIVETNP